MKKKSTAILKFIIAFAVSAALISGCGGNDKADNYKYKGNNGENLQNQTVTDINNSEKGEIIDNSRKEEILKDMFDIPMEDFSAEDLKGNKVRLSDYKGKIIWLNFWATWCPPCKEEMPFMEELYKKYKDKDLVILAVAPTSVELKGGTNSNKAKKQVESFIKENGYTFPVLLDKEDKAWEIYQQRGIPANYIIDKQGIVRYVIPGAFASKEQVEYLIENVRAIE